MFKWKILLYNKTKGLKAIKPILKNPVEIEKNREQELLNLTRNEKIKRAWISKVIERQHGDWLARNPQPFEIGEKVMNNHYADQYHSGIYSRPQDIKQLTRNLNGIPELEGPFILPVAKIFTNVDNLEETLNDLIDLHGCQAAYGECDANVIENYCRAEYNKKSTSFNFYWIIDFDWEQLKIPYENTLGWLDLKWGGFIAKYFISTELPNRFIDLSQELWKDELKFKIEYSKIEDKRKLLEDERIKLQLLSSRYF